MSDISGHVLLVDDEPAMRAATAQWLELDGYVVTTQDNAETALARINAEFDGVVVSDVKMPRMDGLDFLRHLQAIDPTLPVVLVTGHGDVAMAVEAMRQGAYDFIEKPFAPERLLDIVQRACEKRRLVLENRSLRRQIDAGTDLERRMIGNAPAIRRLRHEIADIADTPASVLIEGATGTGKEVVARALHDMSRRQRARFVAVNCAAIPENVFESELFGHEAGAFTGAQKRRIGKLEHADGGTLFLDEVASMPMQLQAKVLRALQEREIVRLGANDPVALDIRIVAASNEDLDAAVQAGRFRADLYYRLNVVSLRLPALKERNGDMALLFDYFAQEAARIYERPAPALSANGLALLHAHEWPGNVRELKNVAERYVLSSLPVDDRLPQMLGSAPGHSIDTGSGQDHTLTALTQDFERRILEASLRRHQGNIQAVMDELGLPRRTLNQKMANHGLERRDFMD